ncbi:SDR family oxidoreductase [Chitinophaga sp. 22321]|uniref:SDR family oxidoreductase n=1 Tax=Chitinophaga hostae TaxID=2831022 RepID=A0ABS5J9U6_9BACT|nr:SDR family oxidoreductase [Chitinophaga hostae]MBS0031988.1 SDR family oxidoreductase [Chitinophaga hostae]
MVKEFNSYWALILGGSSGMGLASARKLAAHGMNICIVHRNTRVELPVVEQALGDIRAFGVQVISFNIDVLNSENRTAALLQLQSAMGAQGRIRCLLHSIARGNLKTLPALQADDFNSTIQNMAVSLYEWAAEILHRQLFTADARILSFTSDGSYKAMEHYAAVSAAKAALEAITRSMALEFATHGIRANCIRAGITDTASLQRIPGSGALLEYGQARNPFHRLTTPEDVANVVYLLCRDEAAWINGAIIPVDGGTHIH